MSWRALGLALALLAAGATPAGCAREESAPPAARVPQPPAQRAATGSAQTELGLSAAHDPRVAQLIFPCARAEHYDRDTSDPIAILVEKLEQGQLDPLLRAKQELTALGERALPRLRLAFERWYPGEAYIGPMQNALDVIGAIPGPAARELVLRALDHESETLHLLALGALGRLHAQPEDYARLRTELEHAPGDVQPKLLAALFAADRARAESELMDWMENGEAVGAWEFGGNSLRTSPLAVTWDRARTLWRTAPEAARAALATAAARAGDEDALAFLREGSRAPAYELRTQSVLGLSALGERDALLDALAQLPEPHLRGLALEGLARLGPDPAVGAAVGTLARQGSGAVERQALGLALRWGDEAAFDHALLMLDSQSADSMEAALEALRGVLPLRDDWTQRVLDRLRAADEPLRSLPLAERLPLLQAIGQLPSASAAQHLRLVALAAAPGEQVRGLRAHEWAMITAANTGTPGRMALAQQLAQERDASRRIDLLWAVAATRCAAESSACSERDFLLEHVDREGIDPYELLYTADRLVHMGTTELLAPRLKRTCLRVTDERVRNALQCMLWRWY
jgi:hypothetical protein